MKWWKVRLYIFMMLIGYGYEIFPNEKIYYLDKLLKNKAMISSLNNVAIFCKNVNCQAKIVVNNKIKEGFKTLIIQDFDKSPASKFCISSNGVPGIVFDKIGNHVSICEFGDGSFFLTWDLLNKIKKSRHLDE